MQPRLLAHSQRSFWWVPPQPPARPPLQLRLTLVCRACRQMKPAFSATSLVCRNGWAWEEQAGRREGETQRRQLEARSRQCIHGDGMQQPASATLPPPPDSLHLHEHESTHDVAHGARAPLERPIHNVHRISHAHVVAAWGGGWGWVGKGGESEGGTTVGGFVVRVWKMGGRDAEAFTHAPTQHIPSTPSRMYAVTTPARHAPFPRPLPSARTSVPDARSPVVHLPLDVRQAAHADVGLVRAALQGWGKVTHHQRHHQQGWRCGSHNSHDAAAAAAVSLLVVATAPPSPPPPPSRARA